MNFQLRYAACGAAAGMWGTARATEIKVYSKTRFVPHQRSGYPVRSRTPPLLIRRKLRVAGSRRGTDSLEAHAV